MVRWDAVCDADALTHESKIAQLRDYMWLGSPLVPSGRMSKMWKARTGVAPRRKKQPRISADHTDQKRKSEKSAFIRGSLFPSYWFVFVQRSTQPFTVLYQSCEFCGFSTQWPSSGKYSISDGIPRRCRVVKSWKPSETSSR